VFQASEEDMESRGGDASNIEFIPPKQITEIAEQYSVSTSSTTISCSWLYVHALLHIPIFDFSSIFDPQSSFFHCFFNKSHCNHLTSFLHFSSLQSNNLTLSLYLHFITELHRDCYTDHSGHTAELHRESEAAHFSDQCVGQPGHLIALSSVHMDSHTCSISHFQEQGTHHIPFH
jgi:hypothetical protein